MLFRSDGGVHKFGKEDEADRQGKKRELYRGDVQKQHRQQNNEGRQEMVAHMFLGARGVNYPLDGTVYGIYEPCRLQWSDQAFPLQDFEQFPLLFFHAAGFLVTAPFMIEAG